MRQSRKSNMFYLSSIPAKMIDDTYLQDPQNLITKGTWAIVRRLMYVLFSVTMVADTIQAGTRLSYLRLKRLLDKNSVTQGECEEFQEHLMKCFRGVLSLPFALLDPRLNTIFFLPKKQEKESVHSGGKLYGENVTIVEPKTEQAVVDLVKQAIAENAVVMARGSGMSQGEQYFPIGKDQQKRILVDTADIDHISVDASAQTVTVGAGAIWAEVQQAVNKEALALCVMQASNIFSVGGSISTNIHGWDHQSGTLANTIKQLKIVNSQGEIQILHPEDELFQCVAGGLGQFGIIIEATLQLRPNVELRAEGVEMPIEQLIEHYEQSVESDPNKQMYLFRLPIDTNYQFKTGVALSYIADPDAQPKVVENLKHEPRGAGGRAHERILLNYARHRNWLRKLYWQLERKQLLNGFAPESINEIMRPPIESMLFNEAGSEAEWLQEYFVPFDQVSSFLPKLGKLLDDNKVRLINASGRIVQADHVSKMPYAPNVKHLALVICYRQSLRPTAISEARYWVNQAYEIALAHNGRFYLPYQHFFSESQFKRAYPQWEEVVRLKEKYDPAGVFSSGMTQRYLHKPATEVNDFERVAEAKTSRHFDGFLDNVLMRVNKEKFHQVRDEVLVDHRGEAEIYSAMLRRRGEYMKGTLSGALSLRQSLVTIKKDLGDQAQLLMPDVTAINGLVEIGYPGRFTGAFKQRFQVTGPVWAVFEAESIATTLETGLSSAYDHFVRLDYEAPDLSAIPDDAVDCLTCFVGLHHFPEETVVPFLQSVNRILRPGGSFLLVDHDADNEANAHMARMAHTTFNLAFGVSPEAELAERRHFHPISYWQDLARQAGLEVCPVLEGDATIREGDPSRNRMVRFKRPAALEQQLTETVIAAKKPQEPRKPVDLPYGRSQTSTPVTHFRQFKQDEEQQQRALGSKHALPPQASPEERKPTRLKN